MATAVEQVERYLEADLALHDALTRGFLNVRRAARWLIDTHGWDTTEEAVVSALRRYRPPPKADLESARHLLASTDLTARTGLAILRLPHVPECLRSLRRVAEALSTDETLAMMPERDHLTVIVDDCNVSKVLELFLPESAEAVFRRVTRIDLQFPERGATAATALAVVIKVFGHKGIDIHAVYGTLPDASLVVSDDQAPSAYHTALALTSANGQPVEFRAPHQTPASRNVSKPDAF